MTGHQHLRELAERATRGPWYTDDHLAGPERNIITVPTYEDLKRRSRAGEADHDDMIIASDFENYRGAIRTTADAEFIAAANPSAVLDLLAEVDRLRAENYLLRQGRGGTPETHRADDRTPLHTTHPIENSREN